ncbi:hypothetical protein BJF93_20830 [Xaviernesmea oryzae]|uniref:Lectin-like protein BA14k n=1 Tax=Xaviernesmea oryzae TaxID=464029 RepID=A0A1Q9AZS7_9HYPH|nr:BA14K family protein [Xaviernesmea oryzae]OLP61237.1 hypothetical protein BJF93_20830 [Xaviernesmea oryzae]SEL51476.1 BA14K-like protein [Xaviernesmea oryzae]
MKSLLSLTFAMVASLGLLMGGLFAATHVSTEGEPHHFKHLGAPLWTSTPHRVDPSNMAYERMAPDPAMIARGEASETRLAALEEKRQTQPDARTELAALPQTASTFSPAHISYCRERYRSYDPADNSYRPFSGGSQPCVSPYMNDQAQATAEDSAGDMVAENVNGPIEIGDGGGDLGATSDVHMQWCSMRYRSYDPASDSYRSYGGEIRRCISPYN